jgi:hypothetical protein
MFIVISQRTFWWFFLIFQVATTEICNELFVFFVLVSLTENEETPTFDGVV